ncbi:MAG: Mur ligase family protein [Eubacteriales bacterium]
MQISGVPIDDEELANITAFIRPFADSMADHPTEFELITVIAFEYFSRHKVDIVVLEVGLGGNLDSTNVINTPELAIITNIGFDHMRDFGATITQIATAKAGIIKPGGDVLIYGKNEEADAVFARTSAEIGASCTSPTTAASAMFPFRWKRSVSSLAVWRAPSCGLVGTYQANNAAVAITAA